MKSKITAAMICLLGASLVLADPPSHAPAHGWRAKHDPYYAGYSGKQYAQDYGILSGNCNSDAIGAVLGGVGGAVIGSQVVDKNDQAVGMVVGGVLGAVLGYAIGDTIDKNDRACMGHALELGKAGQPVVWKSDGHRYSFTPKGDAPNKCRYATLAMDDRKPREVLACPTKQGEWKFSKG
jgi:hypothetical protein